MPASLVEFRHGDYLISSDPARIDLVEVHRALSEDSYWARGRPFDVQRRAIEHSALVVGAYAMVLLAAGLLALRRAPAEEAMWVPLAVACMHLGYGAGVLVGFGGGAASTSRSVLGIHAPMATAASDVAAARRDYLDESGGRYVQVIADGSLGTSCRNVPVVHEAGHRLRRESKPFLARPQRRLHLRHLGDVERAADHTDRPPLRITHELSAPVEHAHAGAYASRCATGRTPSPASRSPRNAFRCRGGAGLP